ncbi:MAG: acetyl-CoA acetyltransferase [Alphaproteobacteria bacterium]|nr:acetyl-CoA acetyltransferase [Alphaproteobacteria bacterium]
MADGICNKVAIIGMGCSKFGERWDARPEDLIIEAFEEALQDAAIDKKQIEAAWFGVFYDEQNTGKSAYPLSQYLRLPNIPVTRVENLCATGTEALRGAAYAVAAGACDIALAMGCEKLKDTGFGGLPERTKGTFEDLYQPSFTPPGAFAQLGAAYAAKHAIAMDDLKRAMAHVSWKSHQNGALNEKAHLQKKLSMEQILEAPMVAYPLGVFDCCGVSDGAACAIVTRPEIAKTLCDGPFVTIKSMQLALSNGTEMGHQSWDGASTITTRKAAQRAYKEAGISDPKAEISLTEVHDCFSITELVLMEDLFLSAEGMAYKDILDGRYDADGSMPCQIDGGLKCFGHPIGASGLRMTYEVYLQLLGRAGARQLQSPTLGMTHNLGGIPNRNVAAISIFGLNE